MIRPIHVILPLLCLGLAGPLWAKEIKTNEAIITNAPDWLTRNRAEKVIRRIQRHLEWSTRRIRVQWHADQASFEKTHNLGSQAAAITRTTKGKEEIHLGPAVNEKNFDQIFGHELVHVIIRQKYKKAIPKWLEEGLANHLAQHEKVDYRWLAKQPFPEDVKELAHPFRGSSSLITYRYKASQALAEMLSKKCDLQNLIRLSVGRKMGDYISTYCEIKDLNAAFRDWVKKKSQEKPDKT